MNIPSRATIERLKAEYHSGDRVELVSMNDIHAPSQGALGTVENVDDIGTIHIEWDNGSTLGCAYGEDIIRKVS